MSYSLPGTRPGPYWVLSTDYDNYVLVYGCTDYLGLFRTDFAWIMSRGRTLAKDTVEELRGVLASYGVQVDRLAVTDQGVCTSMPG